MKNIAILTIFTMQSHQMHIYILGKDSLILFRDDKNNPIVKEQ